MSYEDASISSQAFVFDFERADNYSYNYQYDGGNGISRIKINNNGMAGDIFKVYGSSPQILSAVSLGIYDTNVKYKLSIYKTRMQAIRPAAHLQQLRAEQCRDMQDIIRFH